MADRLTSIRAQLLHKDKATVRALLGKPAKIGYWTTTKPPQGADAATLAAFEAASLDEIWIYAGGRVHFTLAGSAARVDDKTDRDLPPSQNIA